MNLDIGSVSRVGDREENEDYGDFIRSPAGAAAIVCDGLGGHEFGEWASEAFATATLAERDALLAGDYSSKEAARQVFEAVFNSGTAGLRKTVSSRDASADPQTTAVLAVVRKDMLATAHIGDSRAYRLGPDGVAWRSRDHSLVQMLLDEGEVTEEEMGTHPDQGKLFKSIGMEREDKPSVNVLEPLRPGEALLLCSDGFWEHLEQEELASLASVSDLQKTLENLAKLAEGRAQGKSDNVTAICVRPGKGGLMGKVKQWLS